MGRRFAIVGASLILTLLGACSATDSSPDIPQKTDILQRLQPKVSPARNEAFRRAALWTATNVEAVDIRRGPADPDALAFLASVNCEYVDEPLSGHSLKFACDAGNGDIVKVKFGEANGEVYGEVAATRLLWALGFGADRMYPVSVTCHGCPSRFGGVRSSSGAFTFDPAVVERSMAGARFEDDPGWSWPELELVEEQAGGAPRAHRDALKLLAVFLQHSDNKTEQQRLLCVDEPALQASGALRTPVSHARRRRAYVRPRQFHQQQCRRRCQSRTLVKDTGLERCERLRRQSSAILHRNTESSADQ